MKYLKRKNSLEPLKKHASTSLPELPDEFKKRQKEIEHSAGIRKTVPCSPDKLVKKHAITTHPKLNLSCKNYLNDHVYSDPCNLNEILNLVINHPNNGFLYMTTDTSRSPNSCNPYNLRYHGHFLFLAF